jgi:hypothetical protein
MPGKSKSNETTTLEPRIPDNRWRLITRNDPLDSHLLM